MGFLPLCREAAYCASKSQNFPSATLFARQRLISPVWIVDQNVFMACPHIWIFLAKLAHWNNYKWILLKINLKKKQKPMWGLVKTVQNSWEENRERERDTHTQRERETHTHTYIYIYIYTNVYDHVCAHLFRYLLNPSQFREGCDARSIFKSSHCSSGQSVRQWPY